MADAGVGEAMLAAEVLGEAGAAEAATTAIAPELMSSGLMDFWGASGVAVPEMAGMLPEALSYTPTWGAPLADVAAASTGTVTDVVPGLISPGLSPEALAQSQAATDFFGSSGIAVPETSSALAQSQAATDFFGPSGIAIPETPAASAGNWYDAFFKPGGPNTGGILDFYKSMNMMGQLGAGALGGLGLKSMMGTKYGIPAQQKYTGPLSRFSYDPRTYTPYTATPPAAPYRAQYAEGGIAALAQGGLNNPTGPVERMSQNIIGQGGMYPQSQMDKTYFSTPTQMPASAEVIGADYDPRTNPYTGAMMAKGGIADLGSYSDGGRMLKGPGDGMSDSIPGTIEGKQPARLADGEFVVPADVVSHLGNGSTDAGAKRLYGMMDKVRKARTGTKKQGKQIKAEKYMPA